jgi:hypothetical protein
MSTHDNDREKLDRLQERIDKERADLAEMEGTDEEPRFSDDGMIEKGAGTDSNAPPG